ncbi:Golgin family A protein [Citrus sinensis]|uniref:Uncharacterized protein n=1 Tax=Citrus clementina TaxID=85681 RepID=V4S0C5_CITCL|nr:uncharacterized protein PF11_0207 [Citrus x clementina]XP_006493992.2 uncharacterized protein LOC102625890 [Citrus sinensis]ESR33662.1 hypothetical protein CICLE_v10005805mg [Citrus x clementina]KAH9650535.1 Golgin family A protein [Citrus sinensis]
MGNFPSKKKNKLCKKDVRILTEKIRLLREEINGMMHEREKESRAYEREVMVFAFKEAEWKQERKKLKEEVKRLGKNLEEKEEKIREMKDGLVNEKDDEVEWQLLGTSFLMGRMKEERARRDEAVEKWKQLYLAIKTELDELIQRTHGNGLYWRAEDENMIQELKRELRDKEQNIEALKAQLGSVETEVYRKQRDIDILRQSFRIMSHKKKAPPISSCKGFSKKLLWLS